MLKDIPFGEVEIGTTVVRYQFGRFLVGTVTAKKVIKSLYVIMIKWSDDWNEWPYPIGMCNFEVLKDGRVV